MKVNFTLCFAHLIILCLTLTPLVGQQTSSGTLSNKEVKNNRIHKFPFTQKKILPGNNDCDGAEVICDNGTVSFTPSGPGADDFASAANNNGCLNSDENQSAWYYFEMNDDTPPGSLLEFVIDPLGGSGEDYDFAVYGPDVPCDNLGFPIRCSYANNSCFYCPQTGLGNGSNQASEGQFGDGFVAPLPVSAGQGFYLIVDNYLGNSSGFDLEWGGSGAPFLNCTPDCELEVSALTDGSHCPGDIVNISGMVITSNGGETVQWTANPAIAITYLSSSNNPNPTVTIPDDATGTITYTFTATEDDCDDSDEVIITILPPPPTNPANLEVCADTDGNGTFDLTSLDATVGSGNTVTWYDNPAGTPPAIANPAAYVSMGGSVYAIVASVDGCESEPQEVILTLDIPDCDDGCQYTEDSVDADCNCVNTPMPPVCDDNDCSTMDAYNEGICDCEFTPIPPPNCDDNDCNTLDTYNTTNCMCENTPIPPPNCDDNDCTTDDSYDAASCMCINTPILPPSCDDNDCNTLDTYNTTNCMCENTPIPPPDCDDNDCTTDDSYDAASCMCINTPIPPPSCDDNDCNTLDTYNTTNCMCENTPIPPPSCDDNDCTTDDSYDATNCMCINTPIPPPSCDDNDCTTDDSYDAANCMCINTPIPPPSCDDNDCNTLDTYNTTNCMCENTPIPPPNCDDNDCTTDDSYDAANCMCINTPIPPPSCDDNDCNTLDTYNTTNCMCENTPIPPPNCDDNDCTTDDSYDAANCICINTPIPPPSCDDNDCNTLDTYNTTNCMCENTPIPPPNCDDNDCNTLDTYNTTNCMCENTPIPPLNCDDGCALTIDTYNTTNCMCENTPPDPDDGCALTVDSYDADNCQIINTPPDPDDGCILTNDSYDGANCMIINTPPDPDDGCPLTIDIFDGVNCQIINTPPDCDDGCALTIDAWDAANCQCINTPPDPDDGCALTDDDYDAVNCIITNTPPDPDDGCILTADSWDPVNCVIVNIPPNCNDGCQYTTDTFNDATCMCENVLIVPSCDDNDCATIDSYDEANCQCINAPILPPEVMDTSIELCEENNLMATFDLTSVEAFISNNSGTLIEWTDQLGSPILNPSNYLTGTTTVNAFVFDNQNPSCQSTIAFVDLTVSPAPNSGDSSPPSTYCNNQASPINLIQLLNGAQGGGVWAETSVVPTPINAFNANAGTVTPSGIAPGTYTFSYTIPAVGLCQSQTSEVSIIIEANPVIIFNTFSLTTCNSPAEGSTLDLQGTIIFGDLTGNWNDVQGAGVDISDPSNVDFDGVAPGLYLFAYTTAAAISPCVNGTYTLNVFVEDCGCPSVATTPAQGVCNDNGMIDLSTLEITTEDGFWTITSTPIGANPATLTGDNFDASSADAGDYEVTFTLETFPGAACPETSSQIITVSPVPQPNNPGDQEECDAYILPEIIGTDLSGNETYFTGTGGTGAMYAPGDEIDFTTPMYIFDDNGSCSGEVSFNITINDTPELNNPDDQNVCGEYTLPEITGTNLSGNEGYYSQTGGMGTTFNVGDAITTSTQIFIYDANGDCSDEVSFIVNIELTPVLDDPGAQTSCGNFTLPEITGTNLTGTVGYYSESGGMGTNYPEGSEISTNSTIYIYAANGTCDDEVIFTVVLTSAPNAGTAEPTLIVCNDQTDAIFLETLITGEDPGGTWTETSASGSTGGAFNPASGTFNPNNQTAGDYEFTYAFSGGNCPPASSVVTISISAPPSAEFSALVTNTCNVSAAGSVIDLTALLIGGDTGGIWTDNMGAVVSDPTSIDFDGQAEGTYDYQYTTNSAVAPCNDQTYDIEVVVEDCSCPSVATIPPNGDLCQDNDVLDLTTLLLTSEPGNWTITMTPPGGNPAVMQGNNFNASGADAGVYEVTFTLAVAPPPGCPDNSSQMITVSALPQIDNPGTLVGCEEVLLPVIIGTDLATAVYFAESGGTGASFNAGDAITENTTLFILATNGACTNEISFNININQPPNSGTPSPPAAACNDDNTSINLADLLVDEAIGGTWTETSGTASTGAAFNAAAGTFNPEVQVAGTYEFTYTVPGDAPCNEASATVSVNVAAAPFTTFSATTVNVCNVAAQGSSVDLTALISGGDTSGTWTDNMGATVGTPNNLDFDGATPGSLTYTYTTASAVSPCINVSYDIEVVIEDCACPSVATSAPADLCNDAGMLDLTSLEITSEEGTWTITNTPASANPATITGTTFNATNADAGVYELTFTLNVTPTPDCPPSSTQNITISDLPDAGTGSATESCDTNESLIDLTDFLAGSDTDGTWSVNALSDAPNAGAFDATNATFNPLTHPIGVYVFDYTVNGTAPCPNASTSVTVTINPCECPSLELGLTDPLCNDSGMTDLAALQITDEAGTWSITNSPAGANPATITGTTFDASGADAGIYELTFTITATPPDGCPTTNSLEITVNTPPNAGSGVTVSQCNEDGVIDLAALLTGNDAGGTWTLNASSTIPTAGAFSETAASFDPTDNEVGTYIFDYTVSGVTPCPSTMTSVTVNIVSCDCPSVELGTAMPICNDGGSIDLSTLQVTTEIGTWSITNTPAGANPATLTGNNFDATNADAGIYELTFTLNTTPPAGCPTSNAINIEVNALPNAGMGSSTSICEGEDVVTLNDLLTGNDSGGTWSLNIGSDAPNMDSFDATTGSFDLAGNAEGTYAFDYIVVGQNDCPNATASVTVNIIPCDCPSVELGTAAPLCNDGGSIDLTSLQITTEAGTWSVTSGDASVLTGNIFDATDATAGVYELTFTLDVTPAPDCPPANSINITINEAPNAGAGGETSLCEEDGIVDLVSLLTGSDAGGIWSINAISDTPLAGAFDSVNGNFDPLGHANGTYIFDYTVNGIVPCNLDVTSVTVTIVSCDCPSVELGIANPLCNDGGSIDLTSLQITTEAGTWSVTSGNTSVLSGNTFDATNAEAGVYELTFTLNNTPPAGCPNSNAINIEVNAAPNAGTGGEISLCEEDGIVNLSSLLTGSDAGGTWSLSATSDSPIAGAFNSANGTFEPLGNTNGSYLFDYTVDGIAPCNSDVTSVLVTIVSCDCPSVELADANPICNNESLDLSALQITTEAGTWSISDSPVGSTPNIAGTTFNANGTIAGLYSLQFTLDETPPVGCPNNNSILLDVSSSGNAGTADADYVVCNSVSETIDLFGELNGADNGGTWTETSVTPSSGNAFNAANGTFNMTGQTDGTYTFLYTVGNATDICPFNAETVTIRITETPIADAGLDMMIDCNITMVTLTGTSSSGEDVDFSWTNEDGQEIGTGSDVTVNEPGDFILTTGEGGCITTDSVTVVADQTAPDIDAGDDVTLDCDESTFVIQAIGDTGDEFTYDWTTDNGEIENPDILNPTITDDGTYNIVVTNSINGCTSTDQIVISYLNGITGIDMLSQEPPCYQDESGYIFVTNVQGGEQPINFNLNEEDLGETQAFTSLGAGSYELTLTDANGCTWDTLIVFEEYKELELDLGENQFIELGDAATIESISNASVIDTIIWEGPDSLAIECLTSDCLDITASPTETVTLQATIIDANGCETTSFVTIVVRKEDNIFVPNIFSPNNDGENEFFYIFADENILKINKFLVFDRWGETVHEYYQFFPNDPAFGWDGNHRGEPMNPQVLVWFAEVEFVDGRVEIFKGDVTLVR